MSGAAAAAAAKAIQLQHFEEEELTKYSDDEENNWEFKIVRSMTGAFRNPMKLKEVIDKEKAHGWQLIEKFDNNRIRFKRRTGESTGRQVDYFNDPYKIYYGMGPVSFTLLIILITFLGTGFFLLLVALLAGS